MAGFFNGLRAEIQRAVELLPQLQTMESAPTAGTTSPTRRAAPVGVSPTVKPVAGADPAGEFAHLPPDQQRLANTLRARYGPDFDVLGDQNAGLPYFLRRMSEEDPNKYHLDYWDERASGRVEADHAAQMAARNGGGTLGGMANGSLMTPYGKQFDGADGYSILDSPAFKAAQTNATDAIQRSAAAKGTLLTGGTLKDLSDYQMGMGLGAINDQFNRDIGQADFNRGTQWGDRDRAYNYLSGFTQLGQNGAATLGNFGTGYSSQTGQNARTSADLVTGQGDADANADLARGRNNANTTANIINAAGQIDWAKLFKSGVPVRGGL